LLQIPSFCLLINHGHLSCLKLSAPSLGFLGKPNPSILDCTACRTFQPFNPTTVVSPAPPSYCSAVLAEPPCRSFAACLLWSHQRKCLQVTKTLPWSSESPPGHLDPSLVIGITSWSMELLLGRRSPLGLRTPKPFPLSLAAPSPTTSI